MISPVFNGPSSAVTAPMMSAPVVAAPYSYTQAGAIAGATAAMQQVRAARLQVSCGHMPLVYSVNERARGWQGHSGNKTETKSDTGIQRESACGVPCVVAPPDSYLCLICEVVRCIAR